MAGIVERLVAETNPCVIEMRRDSLALVLTVFF